MSISGLGQAGFLNPISLPGISATPGAADKPASPADAAAAKAAASKAAQQATLDEIREKGIYQWAKDQKAEKLKEKIRAEVLASRGTSEADLAKLDPKQRATAESSIAEEIARRVKEAMLSALEDQNKAEAKQGPSIIDISV